MSIIAILGGTGALGGAFADRLARAGHEVWVGSRSPEKAEAFAAELKAACPQGRVHGAGLRAAAEAAEIVVVTVPYAAHADTLAAVKGAVDGKIVVDATVPLQPPKVGTVQLPAAGSAVVEAREALGSGARLVSALQNVAADKLGGLGPVDGDVLVASDDADAGAAVCELLGAVNLRAWFVGPLANSAAAEALTSVLIQINRRYKRLDSGLRITGKPKAEAEAKAPQGLSVQPLRGLPLFGPGDDLAAVLGDAVVAGGLTLEDGDVLVVAQKVVSKVENRAVALDSVTPSPQAVELARQSGKPEAVAELIAAESSEIMRTRDGLVIVRHRLGHVAANAGIDASNVADPAEPAKVLLWPKDPDASALRLRQALEARFGVRLAVVISDSLGRAWRMGTAGAAIGVSGLKPLRDRRGEADLFGRTLEATVVAVADEIASAASLVIGEAAEGVPAALVRGAVYDRDEAAGVGEILRPLQEDLFR